jgi:hypothetical protein
MGAWLLLLLVYAPLHGAPQGELSLQGAAAKAKSVVTYIENCPRREKVVEFKENRWRKEAWGPPTAVALNVQKTNLVLYPFNAVIEFSLEFSTGTAHSSEAEAEGDHDLQPLMTTRNRNTYMLGKREVVLALTEFKDDRGSWHPRLRGSTQCWDNDPSRKWAPQDLGSK